MGVLMWLKELGQRIHDWRYHRAYYFDWPYASPPERQAWCNAPIKKKCDFGYHKVLEGDRWVDVIYDD